MGKSQLATVCTLPPSVSLLCVSREFDAVKRKVGLFKE